MKTPFVPAVSAMLFLSVCVFAQTQSAEDGPKIILMSYSRGNTWAALRDQSQEMAKDFTKTCPELRITTNTSDADYQIRLSTYRGRSISARQSGRSGEHAWRSALYAGKKEASGAASKELAR
jgi:hypothetical protein